MATLLKHWQSCQNEKSDKQIIAVPLHLFPDKRISGVRHERGKRLYFDVSEISPGEMIVGAELRLYQNSNYTANHYRSYTVSIYQVLYDDG